MILICIDNKNFENHLTVNKQYDAVNLNSWENYYYITNDTGRKITANKQRFITLEKHRNKIIDKILS